MRKLLALSLLLGACGGDAIQPITDVNCVADKCDGNALVPGVAEQRVFPKLTFSFPVQMLWSPFDSRAFVVEHSGKVRAFDASNSDADQTEVVLDLTGKTHMNAPPHFEAGLNAIALDPTDRTVMYATYDGINPDDPTNPTRLRWRLSRFHSSDNGHTFSADAEDNLIEMDKNADEHNAGMIAFGKDGFLYVSVGDGGPSFDKNSFGQNVNALYGKMLRLDVHTIQVDPTDPAKTAASFRFRAEAGGGAVLIDHDSIQNGKRMLPYGIPSDNPFASGQGGRPELFAFGLRNPWRWSFDEQGQIWAGDVGQDAYEEVDIVSLGNNYGWGPREARHCAPGRNPCDVLGSIDPIVELQHGPDVNAVIGGFVYRGNAMPLLKGDYIFGNFTPGTVFGVFNENGKKAPEALGTLPHAISGFAEDPDGELYAFDLLKGGIYKLVAGPSHQAKGQAPPYKFLMRAGIGTDAGARAYYASIIPGLDPATLLVNGQPFTEAQWEAKAGLTTMPTASAYYQNSLDLGFWRDMVCTTTIGRGVGGCRVRNWRNEGDKNPANTGNLGTVTMDISKDGVTQFYVFGPDGTLSPFAVLDSEGKKFIPELCTACHAGKYGGAGGSTDLGSIFREWEPRNDVFAATPPVSGAKAPVLVERSTISRQQAEEEWAALNDVAHQANAALHREADGAVVGTDHAADATNAYIESLYTSRNPVVVRDPSDNALLPRTWAQRTGETQQLTDTKKSTWVTVVSRYCMGCHRSNALDFGNYANFQALSSTLGNKSTLEHYIIDDQTDPTRNTTLYMPQSQLEFARIQKDVEARDAAHDWANQANSPTVPVCEVSIEIDGAAFTSPGQDLWVTGNIDVLGNWTPAGGIVLAGTPINGQWTGVWKGTFVVPQGMNIQLKATVIDARGNLLSWEPDLPTGSRNREFSVPLADSATLTGTWGRF